MNMRTFILTFECGHEITGLAVKEANGGQHHPRWVGDVFFCKECQSHKKIAKQREGIPVIPGVFSEGVRA